MEKSKQSPAAPGRRTTGFPPIDPTHLDPAASYIHITSKQHDNGKLSGKNFPENRKFTPGS